MYESFLRLKGRKVCGKDTKKYFGRLSDILVNKETNAIIGIISKNDSLIYRHRLFFLKDICSIDEVSVYVIGYGEKFMKVIPLFEDFKSCENDIRNKRAVYKNGHGAGFVKNVAFDFEAGKMSEFSIGSSLIQDLINGRLICPVGNTVNYLHDGIVIDNAPCKNKEV